jgi:hypothetical protein
MDSTRELSISRSILHFLFFCLVNSFVFSKLLPCRHRAWATIFVYQRVTSTGRTYAELTLDATFVAKSVRNSCESRNAMSRHQPAFEIL